MRSNGKKKKVFVAMSGGVDSSLSAALLVEHGYEVIGVFIKPWSPDWLPCLWRDERHDAMRVAAKLSIPFETLDGSGVYKRDVADYMIAEYKAGRTPNPDVMCNREVKFGLFFNYAMEHGADYVATGHYARVARVNQNHECQNPKQKTHCLLAGIDMEKDQSYFLWTLTQEVLSRTLFPVGEMTKPRVRSEALARGLPVADKKDSQGVCFLGPIDMREFLSHYVPAERGNVLNERGGVIGTHNGALFYTIGQRHGFDITKKTPESGPWYVIEKNLTNNTITVVERYKEREDLGMRGVLLRGTNWIGDMPESGKRYNARIRYRQTLQSCRIEETRNKEQETNTWRVVFDEVQHSVASGQSCVLYNGDECLGGGVISDVFRK